VGRIVKTSGEAHCLSFPAVVEAILCAVDLQRRMAERNADVAAKATTKRRGLKLRSTLKVLRRKIQYFLP
jgi:class 3 adenylate cyclase